MVRRLLVEVAPRQRQWALRLALTAYAVFSLVDWIPTAIALGRGGREGNPVARSLYAAHGATGLLLFKGVVVLAIVTVLATIPRRVMSVRVATWVATVFAAGVALVSLHNLQAVHLLKPTEPPSAVFTTSSPHQPG